MLVNGEKSFAVWIRQGFAVVSSIASVPATKAAAKSNASASTYGITTELPLSVAPVVVVPA